LVEGPNDLLAYNFAIEKKVNLKVNDLKYAKSYLNFNNISIAVHHGKATALLLIELCKHFGLEYFVINDWDFTENFIDEISLIATEQILKESPRYLLENGENRTGTSKGMITTNWKLINSADINKIHFNVPKLETVLGYISDDKSSFGIWRKLNDTSEFGEAFFPTTLTQFLEINNLTSLSDKVPVEEDGLPF
jgi:putative ATP-dependent endonuclease of OLD family